MGEREIAESCNKAAKGHTKHTFDRGRYCYTCEFQSASAKSLAQSLRQQRVVLLPAVAVMNVLRRFDQTEKPLTRGE